MKKLHHSPSLPRLLPFHFSFLLPLLPLGAHCAPFADGDTVVFVGDSITHGGTYHAHVSDYYRTRFPDRRIRIVNAGYGGGTVPGVFPRFDEDIVEYDPTCVAINFGVNDVYRLAYLTNAIGSKFLGQRIDRLMSFRDDYRKLVNMLHAHLPRARLVYIAPCDHDDDRVGPNDCPAIGTGNSLFAGSVLRFAEADKVPFVDWYSLTHGLLRRHQEKNPSFTIFSGDRIHPLPYAHELLAWEFLRAQGVPSLVSEATVDAAARTGKGENATVGDFSVFQFVDSSIASQPATNNPSYGVRFAVRAEALPFPIGKEAEAFADELDFVKTLSHEGLTAKGLPDGEYALLIDGVEVGRYSSAALAKGIELGLNRKTPQYAQAMKVREANAALCAREYKMRCHHYIRNHFRSRAPVDDMDALRKWIAEELPKSKNQWDKPLSKHFDGYLEYWPRHREVRDELWRDQDAVRALARPVRRTYELRGLGK